MSYTSDKNAYNVQINTDISTQTGANTIPPEVVGSGYTDLADLLEPYINAINNQEILSGSGVPTALLGADLDLYYRSQPTYFEIYRKEGGAWVLKVTVPFNVTLPEGNLTVKTSIDGFNVIATKGGWVIANTVYSKATQTGITVAASDLNFYRHDIIYADTLGNIQYLQGTASASPVAPALPANTILIDEVVVPSSSSGFDPYLLFGATVENDTTPLRSDTGALTYEGITIASGTTVNIGACTGYVVDNESVPGESSFLFVNYVGEMGKTVTTLGSGIATYVLLSGAGTIVFQNTFPTSAQRKTHIYLSKISHPAGTITVSADEPDFVLSPLAQFRDLFQALNYVNDGVYPSANGANLTFNVSAGNIHGNGINFVNNNTTPNELAVVPSTPATFLPRTSTGAGGAATTTIDVGNYDVAGVVTAIPGGANTSTLRYIFIVPNLGYIVQYGQTTYASLIDAIAAVGKESSHVVYPSLTNNAILIGVLAATKSATALNNTTQAQFFRADKFGQIIGAQAGVSTGTLQSAYDNSLQPQVVTDATRGALQIKRGSAADTDNVFQVLNAAGTGNFSVTGNGLLTVQAGGEALKVGTNTGLSDNAFIGLYARQSTPTTQSGRIGYLAAGSVTLAISNSLGGISFAATTVPNSQITFSTSGATGLEDHLSSEIRLNPNGGTVSGWTNSFGLFRANSNGLYIRSGLGSLSNGSELSLSTHGGSTGSITPTAATNSLGRLLFNGFLDGSTEYTAATIQSLATEGWTASAGGTKQEFYTTKNTTITKVLALTIDQDQSVKVHGGGEALKVGTNTGLTDSAYIGIYSNQATPTTRTGKIGFETPSSSSFSIYNEVSGGNLSLITAGTGTIRTLTTSLNLIVRNSSGSQTATNVWGTVSSANALSMTSYFGNHSEGSVIRLMNGNGTLAGITGLVSGNSLGRIDAGGHLTSSQTGMMASIRGVATENYGATAGGSKWEFYTTANGTVTQALALTIDQDKTLTAAYKSSASDPTASDIASGYFAMWKNTTSGAVKLWANDGGTLKSVTLS